MEESYFRGDTFVFPFSLQDEEGNTLKFETGDILKLGIKTGIYDDEYALYKEITVEAQTEEVVFEFSTEETQKLLTRDYIIELELTRGEYVDTIYQDEIRVKGDIVNNESKTNSNT